MNSSVIPFAAAVLMLATAAPVAAQDSSTARTQTVGAVGTATLQPTEAEMGVLKRCVRMTPQHREQSSECLGLMNKFGLKDLQENELQQQAERRNDVLSAVSHR